jgi:tetratricopeptide (TPR) repeat protein
MKNHRKIRAVFAALAFAWAAMAVPGAAGADARADLEKARKAAEAGKADEAVGLLTAAIDSRELEGNDLAFAHYNRATLHMSRSKWADAVTDLDRAIALVPDFGDAFHDRGLARAELKKHAEALDDFSRAAFLLPKRPEVFYNRGRLLELMGKRAEAIIDYKHARTLAPRMREPQDALRRLGVK